MSTNDKPTLTPIAGGHYQLTLSTRHVAALWMALGTYTTLGELVHPGRGELDAKHVDRAVKQVLAALNAHVKTAMQKLAGEAL